MQKVKLPKNPMARKKLEDYGNGYWAYRLNKPLPDNASPSYVDGWLAAKSEESRRYRLKRKPAKGSTDPLY